MRNWLFAVMIMSVGGVPAPAQARDTTLIGDWSGVLAAGGQVFRIVLHVARSGDSLAATIDSPDQGARGIAARLRTRPDSIFVVVGQAFSLEGVRETDTLRLSFVQGGARLPLALGRASSAKPPYDEREIIAPGGAPAVTLAGTLTIPVTAKGPSVLLIAGSGPLTRDAIVAGHRQFAVLADSLARAGFVVLRFDKRGTGRSSGDYEAATTTDFAGDAQAMLVELRRHAPDTNRFFVLGHSEGAIIAARLASQRRVSGVVLLAPPALRGDSLMIRRSAILSTAAGNGASVVARESALRAAILSAAVNARSTAEARSGMTAQLDTGLGALSPAERASSHFDRTNWMALIDVIGSQWRWFREFLVTDPLPFYRAVRSPALAIVGERDQQVPPALTTDHLRKTLGTERVIVLPSLNHLLQTATTGSPLEYGSIREAMSPVAIDTIIRWISAH